MFKHRRVFHSHSFSTRTYKNFSVKPQRLSETKRNKPQSHSESLSMRKIAAGSLRERIQRSFSNSNGGSENEDLFLWTAACRARDQPFAQSFTLKPSRVPTTTTSLWSHTEFPALVRAKKNCKNSPCMRINTLVEQLVLPIIYALRCNTTVTLYITRHPNHTSSLKTAVPQCQVLKGPQKKKICHLPLISPSGLSCFSAPLASRGFTFTTVSGFIP